jgi:hypothetical protein
MLRNSQNLPKMWNKYPLVFSGGYGHSCGRLGSCEELQGRPRRRNSNQPRHKKLGYLTSTSTSSRKSRSETAAGSGYRASPSGSFEFYLIGPDMSSRVRNYSAGSCRMKPSPIFTTPQIGSNGATAVAWVAQLTGQKLNFTANCPTLGLTEVLLMTPKVAELKLLSGSANCG